MRTKILIIKLGYSETLDPDIGRVPSLGDVLRTTPILWALKDKYPDSHITWVVSEESEPLLKGGKFIDELLIWDKFVPFQLMREKFDILINLEKIAGVCALSDMIDAWIKYGFRFDGVKGTYHAYEKGLDFISYIKEKQKTDKPKHFWQKVLIEMLSVEWKEQEYIIGYKPKTEEIYDVGLNYKVGSKWPTKAMPMKMWQELGEKLLDLGYKISWQQGLNDLHEYMDWINSNKIIISQDSLGLHIALALKKKVVVLFGSTGWKEVYMYDRGVKVTSLINCPFTPCYASTCKNDKFCMEHINIDEVVKNVEMFKKGKMKSVSYK